MPVEHLGCALQEQVVVRRQAIYDEAGGEVHNTTIWVYLVYLLSVMRWDGGQEYQECILV